MLWYNLVSSAVLLIALEFNLVNAYQDCTYEIEMNLTFGVD